MCLTVQSGEGAQAAVAEAASLKNLRIHLGPELRSMYPFIVNLGLSGDIELRGPLDPSRMCISGTIALDSGEVSQWENKTDGFSPRFNDPKPKDMVRICHSALYIECGGEVGG